MKILPEWPPNIKEIREHYTFGNDVLFAYDDVIYNPTNSPIPPHLIEHESFHFAQQHAVGGAKHWWRKHFEDPVFRIQQEAEAYHAQYEFFCKTQKNRQICFNFLSSLAKSLAGPVYGNAIGYWPALMKIKNGK